MKKDNTSKLQLKKVEISNLSSDESSKIAGGVAGTAACVPAVETNRCDVRTTGTDLPSCYYVCPWTSSGDQGASTTHC